MWKSGLLFAIVFAFITVETSSQRSSYGEPCNKTRRCESKAWLNCFNGTCGCMKQDEMLYEPETGECASKAGERCKYGWEDPDGNSVFEVAPCVANAVCSADGYCACGENLYENTNGTCSSKGRYSESCSDQAPCSETNGLTCVEGTCQCNNQSEWDVVCVGLAGQLCVAGVCTTHATCNNGICNCKDNSFRNFEDKCEPKRDAGGICTSNNHCLQLANQELKCVRGVCDCDPINSIFGTALRHDCGSEFTRFGSDINTQCLGKVGNQCINGYCARGAYCSYYRQSCQYDYYNNYNRNYGRIEEYTGTCSCLPEYHASRSGTCGKSLGANCESNADCIEGLVCSGTCSCRYESQTFDSTVKSCRSPVGGPCDDLTRCTDGADCVSIGSNSSRGNCKCKSTYVEAAGGTCQLKFGMPCSQSTCDTLAGLKCIAGTCQCKDFQQYNEEQQQCMGLVGAKCHLNVKNQCVENTQCVKARGEIDSGRCTCSDGFVINGNYTCEEEGASTPSV